MTWLSIHPASQIPTGFIKLIVIRSHLPQKIRPNLLNPHRDMRRSVGGVV